MPNTSRTAGMVNAIDLVGQTAWITHADHPIKTDATDDFILKAAVEAFNERHGPRVGDFVVFLDGEIHRFSHSWADDGMQYSPNGSWHLDRGGYADFSGGLNPILKPSLIINSGQVRAGQFWLWHRGERRAHNAFYANVYCRVFVAEISTKDAGCFLHRKGSAE